MLWVVSWWDMMCFKCIINCIKKLQVVVSESWEFLIWKLKLWFCTWDWIRKNLMSKVGWKQMKVLAKTSINLCLKSEGQHKISKLHKVELIRSFNKALHNQTAVPKNLSMSKSFKICLGESPRMCSRQSFRLIKFRTFVYELCFFIVVVNMYLFLMF